MYPSPSTRPAAYAAVVLIRTNPLPSVSGQQPADVLDDDHFRSDDVDGTRELRPEPGAGAFLHSRASAGEGNVLAGEPATHDVDRLHSRPVDGADVAVIRDAGPAGGEYLRRLLIPLAMPRCLRVEELFHGEIESADPGEQRSDLEVHAAHLSLSNTLNTPLQSRHTGDVFPPDRRSHTTPGAYGDRPVSATGGAGRCADHRSPPRSLAKSSSRMVTSCSPGAAFP